MATGSNLSELLTLPGLLLRRGRVPFFGQPAVNQVVDFYYNSVYNVVVMTMFNKCTRCSGTGRIADDVKLGTWFRAHRKIKRPSMSIRAAAIKLQISPAYLGFLEKGERHWNLDIERRYTVVLGLIETPR